MPATELAKQETMELAESTMTPIDLRRALALRAAWAAQDDAALLGALREGVLDGAERSVRILPTGQAEKDGSPVFRSVGPDDSPDVVLGPMIGHTFTVHHQAVRVPSTMAIPEARRPALPPPTPSMSTELED